MVGLSAEKLFSIVCKSPDLYPKVELSLFLTTQDTNISFSSLWNLCIFLFQVSSKPVLSLLDLSYPLASSDLGADTLEKEFIFRNTRLLQVWPFPCSLLSILSISLATVCEIALFLYKHSRQTLLRNLPCFRFRKQLTKQKLLVWIAHNLMMKLSIWKQHLISAF